MYPYKPKRNTAFRVGLIAGLLVLVIHLIFMLITQERSVADFIAWIFEMFVLYFAGRTAANQQFNNQQQDPTFMNPASGVMGAGIGAALITVVFAWAFVILRDVVMDAPSLTTTIGLLRLPYDFFSALGLGAWAGHGVNKRLGNGRGDFR